LSLLVVTVISSTIPFDNDEANHAVDGWEVYHAFTAWSPRAIYRAVTDQGFYPPVHSFFVAAAYLVAGPSFMSSRLPTVVIFALALLLLAWLTLRLGRRVDHVDPPDGWLPLAGAAFAVAFAITSEIFVLNTVLVMLEMTGALFGMLFLGIVDQVDESGQGHSRWIGLLVAAVIAVVLLLTKYTFGLFYLPGLLAALLTATWPWKADRLAWRDLAGL
jgi:4-amino-4-deoxy-L-arabinose transferase-like glycosyltransferase